MIQTGSVFRIGTGVPTNQVGAWFVVIPTVEATTVWCAYFMSARDVLPSAMAGGSVNVELGVGGPGLERRRWRSILNFGGGGELEFDDSYWSVYAPYTFRKGETISVRTARHNISVGLNVDFQLQLHS